MTRAVSLVLALTLSSAPVANIVCAAWCDARFSATGGAADVCHSQPAHHLFAVLTSPDSCAAFAGTPFIREDTRRVAPAAISITVACLSANFIVPEPRLNDVSAGTARLPADRAQMLVLRI
jgi:hypothetical protein